MKQVYEALENSGIIALIVENLGRVGLVMDIGGVVILFFCTLPKRIEAEIAYNMMRDVTDDIKETGGEWVQPYSFQEHEKRMANSYKSVKKNRIWGK